MRDIKAGPSWLINDLLQMLDEDKMSFACLLAQAQPVNPALVDRITALVGTMEVDLDAPLQDGDEK